MWFFHVDTRVFQHHLLETVAPTWNDFCSIVTWPSLYGAISGLFWCRLAVCPQGVPEQPWGSLQAPPLLRSFLAEIFVPPPAIRWWEAGEKEQGPLLDHSLPSVGGKRPVPCVKLLQTSAAATVAAAPAKLPGRWDVRKQASVPETTGERGSEVAPGCGCVWRDPPPSCQGPELPGT